MAEGIQLAALDPKYYCHRCSREVSPFHTAHLVCPECSGGFVEIMSKDLHDSGSYPLENYDCDDDSDFDEVNSISLIPESMNNIISRMLRNVAETLPEPELEQNDSLNNRETFNELMREYRGSVIGDSEPDTDYPSFRYFDDYSFDDEVDALASQLLDDVEISGPAPLSKDQIKALSAVLVSSEDVEKGSQCTVCMDDFRLKDKAKRLPCKHLYHEKCITPWLERQATCPNCRDIVEIQPKDKRSRSVSRSRLTARHGESRLPEASSIMEFFQRSVSPFRFLN